jgi:23S rRNA pseudouridine1911/1915/1917 synthase
MSGAPASTALRLIATPEDAGQRIDVYLSARLPGYSRSQAQRLIREGQVLADGKRIKGSLIVTAGLTIDVVVPPPLPATPAPEALPLSILHDDDDLVVVDKPSGMVVHPAPGHATGTLVNALLHHVRGLSGIGGQSRPGIVHRLDRGTSGVMVVAKHDRAHQALSKQFQDRTVRKVYVALVWGRPEAGRSFDSAIGRDPNDRQKISSRARRSRSALTTVNSVEVLNGVSLVYVTIGSGRTHQIRVHLSEAGYPIVGDVLYGGDRKRYPGALSGIARLERPFLHASQLAFAHPADGRTVTFEAPLPRELAVVVDALRRTAASRLRSSVNTAGAADGDSEGDRS